MDTNPKVSVLIPLYNAELFIARTIESVVKQNYSNYEIIIIDDFSTDSSYQIVQQIALSNSLIKLYTNKIKGGNNARNYAFSLSSGDYIEWLDADDIILPGKFHNQVKVLESNKNIDVVYSDWIIENYSGTNLLSGEVKKCIHHNDYLYQLLDDNWQPCHSYLMRRSLAKKLDSNYNGWDPTILVGQDREYFTMATIIGKSFVYVPGTYSVYQRQIRNSVSNLAFNKMILVDHHTEMILLRFILKNEIISASRKIKYKKIIHAHIINGFYHNHKLRIHHAFSPFNIIYGRLQGRIKVLYPLIWLQLHLHYSYQKLFRKNY
jgi:glycosyltransferase involved in cell wall biosynthesis